tara:strand:- start:31149 stop:32732 length:1584 start_codon:yes stop_codon:yes gene_type:complete
MNRFFQIACIVFTTLLQAQVPQSFLTRSEGDTLLPGFQSNVIVEIRIQGDSTVWFGTGKGLSVMRDSISINTFESSENFQSGQQGKIIPIGGVSAIGVSGKDTLLVATAKTVKGETAGGGLALSYNASNPNNQVIWNYFNQPIDSIGDSTISWGDVSLKALPVTVIQNNVTYDIAIGKRYYWIATWAGGLRRLNKNDISKGWKRVPLPEDNQTQLLCREPLDNYQLNPRDPPEGNHNHKVFSVMTYGDTVWVGTANGINRGIIDDSGCVDWVHYSFPLESISGNWVVSLSAQQWSDQRIVWAVTRAADETGEKNGLSYTNDEGETWQTIPVLNSQYGYNVFSVDSLVYFSSSSGLWRTEDGQNFAHYSPAIDRVRNDQVIDNDVYTSVHDRRPYYNDVLWIGTGDGMARSSIPSSDDSIWRIFRSNVSSNNVYAYPNPFSPTIHNLLDGDGYVRFYFKAKKSKLVRLTILSFAMETVRTIDFNRGSGEGTLKWDGRDDSGRLVSNGTYFCNVFYDGASHWVKLVVVK